MKTAPELWKSAPQGVLTTGIGSLPYHNVDAALEHSFALSVPFLPQIPLRHVTEYMIPQALEGLPGLVCHADGMASVDLSRWTHEQKRFTDQLKAAFSQMIEQPNLLEFYEPSPQGFSAWRPFLYELEERRISFAKVELAGPLTSQWSVSISDGSRISDHPDLSTTIFQLVLARSLAMIRKLQSIGVTPLIYLDEPGLYIFSPRTPSQAMQMAELKLVVQTLQRSGALVGLHCCSETDWGAVMDLRLDVLSIDTHLSLKSLLLNPSRVDSFLSQGGRLSLGIIPTGRVGQFYPQWNAKDLLAQLLDQLTDTLEGNARLISQIVRTSLYTPACGLALHPTESAEAVLGCLNELARLMEKDRSYGFLP